MAPPRTPSLSPSAPTGYTLKKVISLYILHALMVILAAIFLPFFAEGVAARLNLSQSFVGTLFLAGSTSLPEVAVSLSAVRLGSVDLAVGNLFGSNLFNILILAIDDLVYTRGNLLKDASENNIISVFSIIIMTAVAISGILFKPQKKSLLLTWDTLLILVIYTANVILLYYINHT
ncbi:MAG: hypothetical protein KatS3mg031_1963 [Chitinophagales bacterium]|nr:MAG: hypothetical protein KatS3mg031_1963 [Chitinophagales bacterium]